MNTKIFPIRRRLSLAARRACGALAVALTGGALLTAAPAAAATNLVTNGTFAITGGSSSFWWGGYSVWGGNESLAGWAYIPSGTTSTNNGAGFVFTPGSVNACYGGSSSCTGSSIEQVLPTAVTAPGGSDIVAIDGDWGGNTQLSGISQSISGLTVGKSYTLSFSYALAAWYNQGSGASSLDIEAVFGTSSQSTPTVSLSSPNTVSGWATATFTFVANSTQQTLQLLAANGTGAPPLALIANVSLAAAPEPMSIVVLGTGVAGLLAASRRRRASAPAA